MLEKSNRAVGPEDFKRPQRGSIIDYKAENSSSNMENCMLYNFPHSMGSENLILTTFQKKAHKKKVFWEGFADQMLEGAGGDRRPCPPFF